MKQLMRDAQHWATPTKPDGGGKSRSGDRRDEMLLPGQAQNWATPNVPTRGPESRSSKAARGAGGIDTQTQAVNWPSARAEDAESAGNHPGATDSLTGATKNWPSPAARDYKGPNGDAHRQTRERAHDDQLPNAVATFPSSRPDETITDDGLDSLLEVWTPPLSPRLSPGFQFWLMGWGSPIRTYFDSEAMALYRVWLLSHLRCCLENW